MEEFTVLHRQEFYALGISTSLADGVDFDADAETSVGHEHEFILFFDGHGTDDVAGFLGDLHRDDAFAAARLQTVFFKGRAFAETVFSCYQQGATGCDECEADNIIAVFGADAPYSCGGAAHTAGLLFVETNADAVTGDEHNFIVAIGEAYADQFIAFFKIDGVETRFAVVAVIVEWRFFHQSDFGCEQDESCFVAKSDVVVIFIGNAFEAQQCSDFFLGLEIENIADATTFRSARAFGDVIDALHIHTTRVGEKHQVVMRLGGEQMLDEVIFLIARGSCFHAA